MLWQVAGRTKFYNWEEVIGGDFKKWSNNVGWKAHDIPRDLVSLSKWTHDITGGYIMLTDMQGVESAGEFVLTDPAILCEDARRFQPTNLGTPAIKMCYEAMSRSDLASAPSMSSTSGLSVVTAPAPHRL